MLPWQINGHSSGEWRDECAAEESPIDPHLLALTDAQPSCFWLDQPDRPEALPALAGSERANLLIVGGGFTGLWAAVQAVEEEPARDVVLLEADAVAEGASGRNGGFADPSLTHGLSNGLHHFPGEMESIEKLGSENCVCMSTKRVMAPR